ncbi:hypothetical protein D3C80_2098220 [compost metagenome]
MEVHRAQILVQAVVDELDVVTHDRSLDAVVLQQFLALGMRFVRQLEFFKVTAHDVKRLLGLRQFLLILVNLRFS